MQKGTKKIFGWANAFRLPAALERRPAEAVFMFKPSAPLLKMATLFSRAKDEMKNKKSNDEQLTTTAENRALHQWTMGS